MSRTLFFVFVSLNLPFIGSTQCTNICGSDFISNGDFETVSQPDCSDPNLFAELFIDRSPVADWIGTVQSNSFFNIYSPDYLSPNCNGRNLAPPCEGSGSLGFFTVPLTGDPPSEYVQSQLTMPLEAGREYCIEFEVASSMDVGTPGDGLDVFLVNDLVDQDIVGLNIPFTPVYSHPQGSFIPESCTLYSFNYTATGGEEWIVFGNKDADQTQTQTPGTQAYVILDNVSLFEVGSAGPPPEITIQASTTQLACGECTDLELEVMNLNPATPINWVPDFGSDIGPYNFCPDQDTSVIAFVEFSSCGGQVDTIADTLLLEYNCIPLDFDLQADPAVICEGECTEISIVNLQGTAVEFIWTDPTFSGSAPQTDCPTQSTEYGLSVVSAAGDTVSRTIEVIVQPAPDVSIIDAGPFCEGGSDVLLEGFPAGGDWSGDVNSAGVFPLSQLAAGNYLAIYTYTDNNGCSNADTIDLEILGNTTVNFLNIPDTICSARDSFQIRLDQMVNNGIYVGPGVDSFTGWVEVAVLDTGRNFFEYQYGVAECRDTVRAALYISRALEVTIDSVGPFCAGDANVQLNAMPSGGSWTGDVDTTGLFPVSTINPGQYNAIYTRQDSNGCVATDSVRLVVSSSGGNSFENLPNQLCSSQDSFQIQLSNPNTGGSFFGQSVDSSGLIDASSLVAGDYPISYISGSGNCIDTITELLTILPPPAVSIIAPESVCEGSPDVQLTAAPAPGQWSGNVTPQGLFRASTLAAGSYRAIYSFVDSNNCRAVDSVDIEIIPQLNIQFSNLPDTLCPQDATFTIELDTMGFNGRFVGRGVDEQSGELAIDELTIGANSIQYIYGSDECRDTTTGTVYLSGPVSIVIDSVGPFCIGEENVQLNAAPVGGTWSGDVDPSGVIPVSNLSEGSYLAIYEYRNDEGCFFSDSIVYEIIAVPEVSLIVPADPLCANEEAFNIDIAPAGTSGRFEGNGVSTAGRVDPAQIMDSTEVLFIYGADNCRDTARASIRVLQPPNVELDPQGPFCLNDSVIDLQANPPGGLWSGDVDESGQFNPQQLGAGFYSASYRVENEACTAEDSLVFEVDTLPSVEFTNWQSTFRIGDPLYDIELNPNGLMGLFNGPGIIDADLGIFSPSNAGVGRHRISYILQANGCSLSIDSTLEVVGGQWYVPNVFTPNGDGVNDVFEISALPAGEWNLKIFDRWGNLLFETNDAETDFWDGSFRGQRMNPGVYVWSLSGTTQEGDIITQLGSVTLQL
jgi:gliding motility-associated-like protein